MPEWIHNRAEHILAKNPSMPKSEAFAIATQQSHATGHTPKSYGTPTGKHKAKEKYDTPGNDEQKANPGNLDSPKMASLGKEAISPALISKTLSTAPSSRIKSFIGNIANQEAKAVKTKLPVPDVTFSNHGFWGPSDNRDAMRRAAQAELNKRAAAVPPPLPAAANAVKSVLPKPKLYGEEGFQALMQGARGAKTNPLASILQKRAALAFLAELDKIDADGKEKSAMNISGMAERMKLGFAKIKTAATLREQADTETKGTIDSNIERPTVGTEHSQAGEKEQKDLPTEGYLWGQDPPADQPAVGKRSPTHETLTDSGEAINAMDNFDLLRRDFTNMDAASNNAKATIEQNFENGRRGSYVTHSQTLLEKVRNVAGRI